MATLEQRKRANAAARRRRARGVVSASTVKREKSLALRRLAAAIVGKDEVAADWPDSAAMLDELTRDVIAQRNRASKKLRESDDVARSDVRGFEENIRQLERQREQLQCQRRRYLRGLADVLAPLADQNELDEFGWPKKASMASEMVSPSRRRL